MNFMALEEKSLAPTMRMPSMSVSWNPCLTTTIFVVVSYRLQRGDLAFPVSLCEHLVSHLHVEHAPVLRRDEVNLLP